MNCTHIAGRGGKPPQQPPISRFSWRNEGYPNWSKFTFGFDSPGGDVQVRFRFTSDLLCSGADPACGSLFAGLRVDEVVVGRQAS